MQRQYCCFFFVADFHSLTTYPKAADLHKNVRDVVVEYLASGIDPDTATLYVQSDLPQIPELYLYLNMLAYLGELERSASFKDKVRTQPDNVNAGLLTYPVLMAADIIIHRAQKVPVGKDQEQHLEMTRNYVNRFNNLYGEDFFPEPVAFGFDGELVKVPGLDGGGKMSKSNGENTAIFLRDSEEAILKKMKKAVTDSGPPSPGAPKSQAVQNLFDLMKLVSSIETVEYFETEHQKGSIRYGDLKVQLAKDMNIFIAPIRERIAEIDGDEAYLAHVLKNGAEKARESAEATLAGVRRLVGIRKFY